MSHCSLRDHLFAIFGTRGDLICFKAPRLLVVVDPLGLVKICKISGAQHNTARGSLLTDAKKNYTHFSKLGKV